MTINLFVSLFVSFFNLFVLLVSVLFVFFSFLLKKSQSMSVISSYSRQGYFTCCLLSCDALGST